MSATQAQQHKALGNSAFAAGDFASAAQHFTDAIAADPSDHVFFSNRSASYASLNQWPQALSDAKECVRLAPNWARGFGRLGTALHAVGDLKAAGDAFGKGLALDPQSAALADGAKAVREARRKEVEKAVAAAQLAKKQQQQKQEKQNGDNEREDKAETTVAEDYVVGIDLGTTMSCVAVWRNGAAEVLADSAGMRITPSWVSFDKAGHRVVGQDAKRNAVSNPQGTLFNIKRIIGRDFADCSEDLRRMPFAVAKASNSSRSVISVPLENGRTLDMAPEQVSAAILEHMKNIAERALGQPVRRAVVTVPAYFNDSQRRFTKDAGAIAGLEILRIINEPTAAALAYGLDKCPPGSPSRNVLVFDLGGGTFDVSLLQINDGMFEVLATAGDTHLGGEDFDSLLSDWVLDQHRRSLKGSAADNDPFTGPDGEGLRRKLRNACESAKRELSSCSSTLVELSAGGQQVSVEVTRSKFDTLNEKTFQRCLDSVKRVLSDAKVKKDLVDEVVLVGGSTRVPRVQTILSEFFGGKVLCKSVNPDEAVAFGAAVQGAILSGVRDPLTQALLLVDVTPLSLGVGCEGHKFARVVPRNTQVPCKMTSEFTTVHDNQTTIDIDVLEGESPNSRDNHLLGSFEISGVERAKQGVPKIDVTFDVSTDGILTVSARDKVTGAAANVEIQHDRGRLSQEEIARMCQEAERMRLQAESEEQ